MVTSFPVESGFTIPKIALATESVKVLGPVIAKLSKSSLSYKKMNQYLDSTFDLMFAFARNQETIYRFDAMFDTKSAVPDSSQLF